MNVQIVGKPNSKSDADIARFLKRFLEGEHPGTSWRVRERPQDGSPLEPAAGKLDVGAGRPDDKGTVAA
jgi:hypothetical protein